MIASCIVPLVVLCWARQTVSWNFPTLESSENVSEQVYQELGYGYKVTLGIWAIMMRRQG